ncbi:hypothetical protein I545_0123 [Mycobacterium kansasii 662]|uniref:Uncharacterized protein n=2 Tax=Mycobacterium kansasii TaxID=1768 RepID=A0A1V3XWP8_MYCKA|nr:hypothetical protein I547_1323 [Mycobacterium kansasii 824]EUA22305.1 hypothetical protein I545_0123 [Mycobacterium kansasii 662]KEP43709.1 hypothetical protein MKSMC1_10730 [Mycobacterium kansasii]OOK83649.1 hypothetical protein BZL29_0135 [Mycobacterium kansasii]
MIETTAPPPKGEMTQPTSMDGAKVCAHRAIGAGVVAARECRRPVPMPRRCLVRLQESSDFVVTLDAAYPAAATNPLAPQGDSLPLQRLPRGARVISGSHRNPCRYPGLMAKTPNMLAC